VDADANRNHSPSRPHDIWTSMKRLIFYILIMYFRGWVLYVAFNAMEETIQMKFWPTSDSTSKGALGSCWYGDLLWKGKRDSDPCYGQSFDFSDHVVLFYSHSMPCMIFEMMFCFLVPIFWPFESNTRKKIKHGNSMTTKADADIGNCHPLMHYILNLVLPVVLLLAFAYLNIITLISVHVTAAYFHTPMEISVGYAVSLMVQIPVGLILCSDSSRWEEIRKFVGFP